MGWYISASSQLIYECAINDTIVSCVHAGEGTHIYMPPLHLLFVEMMIPTDTCEDHCIRTYSDSTEHTVDYYSSIQTY